MGKAYYAASMIVIFLSGINTGINGRALMGMDRGFDGSMPGMILPIAITLSFGYVGWIIKDRD